MLWLDKHRPTTLGKLDVHPDLTDRLRVMSKDGEIPHLLFYGPSGAGKRTRILALLKEIFGPGAERVHLEHRTFKTPTNRVIELTTVASNYHIEMAPADAGSYDRFVVQEVIKEIAGSTSLTASLAAGAAAAGAAARGVCAEDGEGGGAGGRRRPGFKVVLLTGVDSLTKQAQAALRRTMERYTSSCRLILCCNSISKVIDPVRSRCLGVRVPAPSETEICSVLSTVCKREGLALPPELASRVSRASGRNLRRALLMLEACKVEATPLSATQRVALADWETYIESIAKDICTDQSPTALLGVRGKLYELLVNCIPADVILRRLARELMAIAADDTLKHEVAHWAAFYDARLRQSSKEIFQLEAFVAKYMMLYKAFITSQFMPLAAAATLQHHSRPIRHFTRPAGDAHRVRRPTTTALAAADGVAAMRPKALVAVAQGTEEIEAVTIIDTLVRAGVDVTIASVADINQVKCSRGVELVANCSIRDCVDRPWDLVALPGGMPGAEHLAANSSLQHILKDQNAAGKLIGAICASPAVVLAPLGILDNRKATCYPADKFTAALPKYDARDEGLLVVEDGHVVTSRGPGTSLVFSLRLAARLMGDETEARLSREMLA